MKVLKALNFKTKLKEYRSTGQNIEKATALPL
jgi:hypothetical protein